jgi:hypothetical protein
MLPVTGYIWSSHLVCCMVCFFLYMLNLSCWTCMRSEPVMLNLHAEPVMLNLSSCWTCLVSVIFVHAFFEQVMLNLSCVCHFILRLWTIFSLTRACACETEMRRCAHVTVNRLLWMWTGFSECEWVCACECGRWMCEVRECERCQFLCVNVNSAWMWKVSVFYI